MDVDVSIDRVSFVGRCCDPGEFFAWIKCQDNYRVLPQLTGVSDGLRWVQVRYQSAEGVNVSLRLRVPDAMGVVSIERWSQIAEDEAAYRVEWNPNKSVAVGPMLFAERVRPTRVDVALDYDGMDLDDWHFERPRCRSSRYYDAAGGAEGLMLGRMGSSRFLVVYDKGAELGIADMVGRFEFRQRVRPLESALSDGLFDGVCAIRREIPRDVSPREAAMVALKLMAPDRYAECDRDTRRKYDRLMAERCGRLAPDPAEVYRRDRDRLRSMLQDLADAREVPIARVYKGTGHEQVKSTHGPGAKEAPSPLSTLHASSNSLVSASVLS